MMALRTTKDASRLSSLFREGFRRQAATVSILTYRDRGGQPCGMTATSVCSLSAAPPSLVVCVNRSAKTYDDVRRQGCFGIDFLAESQEELSTFCSKTGAEKHLSAAWLLEDQVSTAPVLREALAHFDCQVTGAQDAFTHAIIVGKICDIWLNPLRTSPLLYFDGSYYRLGAPKRRLPEADFERYMGWGV
jgi:flavin reductase